MFLHWDAGGEHGAVDSQRATDLSQTSTQALNTKAFLADDAITVVIHVHRSHTTRAVSRDIYSDHRQIRARVALNVAHTLAHHALNHTGRRLRHVRIRVDLHAKGTAQRALGRTLRVQVNADTDVPEPAASVIERVVREGVSNIERHSCADLAVITVDVSGDGSGGVATVDVYDNGDGIIGEEGFGIKGLRARLAEVGGTLTIDGTVLAASVPVEEQ